MINILIGIIGKLQRSVVSTLWEKIYQNFQTYSVDSIKRTVHSAFHGLFSLLKILFISSKQYF